MNWIYSPLVIGPEIFRHAVMYARILMLCIDIMVAGLNINV